MVRPGDNPMQKLAMMMAVMILGMSPAHGYSISADSGSLEIGGQAKMVPLLPRWYSDGGTLTARNMVNSDLCFLLNQYLHNHTVHINDDHILLFFSLVCVSIAIH
jgi:hypothetical protein